MPEMIEVWIFLLLESTEIDGGRLISFCIFELGLMRDNFIGKETGYVFLICLVLVVEEDFNGNVTTRKGNKYIIFFNLFSFSEKGQTLLLCF